MGQFEQTAQRLAAVIDEMRSQGGITADQIPEIIGKTTGETEGSVNCYPGTPGLACCDIAFFISLSTSAYTKGRGHLSCRQAMEKVVQHMQGVCFQNTRFAVLITDSWDPSAYDDWRWNIENINRHAGVEVYLISGRTVSRISI